LEEADRNPEASKRLTELLKERESVKETETGDEGRSQQLQQNLFV